MPYHGMNQIMIVAWEQVNCWTYGLNLRLKIAGYGWCNNKVHVVVSGRNWKRCCLQWCILCGLNSSLMRIDLFTRASCIVLLVLSSIAGKLKHSLHVYEYDSQLPIWLCVCWLCLFLLGHAKNGISVHLKQKKKLEPLALLSLYHTHRHTTRASWGATVMHPLYM